MNRFVGIELGPHPLSNDVAKLYFYAYFGDKKPGREHLSKIICDYSDWQTEGLVTDSDQLLGAVSIEHGYLTDCSLVKLLVIAPDHQRSGYGRALMSRVEELAILNGNTSVRLNSWAESKPFYMNLGFTTLSSGILAKAL